MSAVKKLITKGKKVAERKKRVQLLDGSVWTLDSTEMRQVEDPNPDALTQGRFVPRSAVKRFFKSDTSMFTCYYNPKESSPTIEWDAFWERPNIFRVGCKGISKKEFDRVRRWALQA